MKLLFDTHALLWTLLDSPRLGKNARAAIVSGEHELLVSAVSAMEVSLKYRIGKLSEAAPFLRNGKLALDDLAYSPLAISFDHASEAGSLDIPHKDPFDRLLIAQARIEDVTLLSNETIFDDYGVRRIW